MHKIFPKSAIAPTIVVIRGIAVLQTISMLSVQPPTFAAKIVGTEAHGFLIGTPGNDKIDSKGGPDTNYGESVDDDGYGDDKINSGKRDDQLTGQGGADKFQCGSGEDTVTDFNEAEGDKASGNCENLV